MKMTNCLLALSVIACLSGGAEAQSSRKGDVVNDILGQSSIMRKEGSGVGGGVLYDSIVAWCDDTGVILDESRIEAREMIGFGGNYVGALQTYYNGLKQASQVSQEAGSVTLANSVTLKYVTRGLKLAQILGATRIINGEVDTTTSGLKKTESLVSFFDWYVDYTKGIGEDLDKVYYVPYIIQKNCTGKSCDSIPKVSTIELEKRMINTTVTFLKQLEPTFVRLKSDDSNFYTVIRPEDYLKALSFITQEVTTDVNESLFANAYSCQARKLTSLSNQLKLYVETRGNGELDAIKLNRFTLELRRVITSLENKRCF